MNQLADVVTFSKRRESRKERVIPWNEFEPYLNQLRTQSNCSIDEAMRICGYSGGTMLSQWRQQGAPILALNAIRWVLHDLQIPAPAAKAEKQFAYGDLLTILGALAQAPTQDRGLIAIVAKEIAKYD